MSISHEDCCHNGVKEHRSSKSRRQIKVVELDAWPLLVVWSARRRGEVHAWAARREYPTVDVWTKRQLHALFQQAITAGPRYPVQKIALAVGKIASHLLRARSILPRKALLQQCRRLLQRVA